MLKNQNTHNSLMSNTIIISIGMLGTKVISFFIVPLFSKWLIVSDYGLVDLCNTLVALVVPIITVSCGEAIFRFLIDSVDAEDEKLIITNSLSIYIVGWFLGAIVSLPICKYMLTLELYPFFLIYISADSLFNFSTSVSRGLKQTKLYSVSGIINTSCLAFFSFLLVRLLSYGIKGLILSYSIGYFVSSIFILIRCQIWKMIDLKSLNRDDTKELLSYSIPNLPNTVSWWIMQASDRTVIKFMLGAAFNGIYAVANYIPAICTSFYNAFHLSWQQDISEKINSEQRSAYVNNIMNNTIQSIVSLSCVIICSSYFIFKFLFSVEYVGAYAHAAILVFATLFSFISQFLGGILVGLKQVKKLGTTTVIAAITNLGINFLLIKGIGLYAASISTLVCYIVLFIIRFQIVNSEIAIHFKAKTVCVFFMFVIMFVLYFIDSFVIRIISFLFSIIFFLLFNKNLIIKILRIKL